MHTKKRDEIIELMAENSLNWMQHKHCTLIITKRVFLWMKHTYVSNNIDALALASEIECRETLFLPAIPQQKMCQTVQDIRLTVFFLFLSL